MRFKILLLITSCVGFSFVCIAQNKSSNPQNQVNSLEKSWKAYFKKHEHDVVWIRRIDSLNSQIKTKNQTIDDKESVITDQKDQIDSLVGCIKAFNFILNCEKDSLNNLDKDTTGYVVSKGAIHRLLFPNGADTSSLERYIGRGVGRKQFPLFYSALDSGTVRIINNSKGNQSNSIKYGILLPDWPVREVETNDLEMSKKREIFNLQDRCITEYIKQVVFDPYILQMYKSGLVECKRNLVKLIGFQTVFWQYLKNNYEQ